MKKLLMIAVLLISCNSTKHLDKVVKRYGAKETIEHLTEKYPEYFTTKTSIVTVNHIDTIYIQPKDGTIVGNIIYDTIFFKDKNIDLSVNKTTGKGHYKLPKDTLIVHDTIRLPVTTRCPEVTIWTDKIKEQDLKFIKYKNKTTLAIIIESFLLLLCLVIFLLKFLK